MRLPKYIIILDRTWEIIIKERCPWQPRGTEIVNGSYHWEKGHIWIEAGIGIDEQQSALFHEVHEIILRAMYVAEYDWDKETWFFNMDHNKFRDTNLVLRATIIQNHLFY